MPIAQAEATDDFTTWTAPWLAEQPTGLGNGIQTTAKFSKEEKLAGAF